ncbi:isocitrate lyase/PEP mutase family protein [Mesorhizobium sp. B1-1-8]|uniref:isocitrate lyase/PEP mutase family protein n=1 Tax=Mesorhizobium sp. B1-1-8 TaxID=2589976 RepID=UPI00112BF493|nr:isocitrate lyase/PEP mutase family protein [Mesorhizobium sp. B1-1-8]UCI06316.1 isocitrate lyase/PEP mutase family protein [Mesorhizobium sp. B1-1-8]
MRLKDGERPSWKSVLDKHAPLILPSAPDALTARLIERAGFPAYQIGGFALAAHMHAVPDIDLEQYGENHAKAKEIIDACGLPVLVDGDDGYGDVKNVTRTVRGYEAIGASALFIEDQQPPKRCGHMADKRVISAEAMAQKIRAAAAARRSPDFFIMARTDAAEPDGIGDAIERGQRYVEAGADGVYVEGPTSVDELKQVGAAFKGVPLATSILEGGGKTPWLSPRSMHELGFSMILYPTSVLFRQVRAVQDALDDLRNGLAMKPEQAVTLETFEDIVGMPEWADIENRFMGQSEQGGIVTRIKQKLTG